MRQLNFTERSSQNTATLNATVTYADEEELRMQLTSLVALILDRSDTRHLTSHGRFAVDVTIKLTATESNGHST